MYLLMVGIFSEDHGLSAKAQAPVRRQDLTQRSRRARHSHLRRRRVLRIADADLESRLLEATASSIAPRNLPLPKGASRVLPPGLDRALAR